MQIFRSVRRPERARPGATPEAGVLTRWSRRALLGAGAAGAVAALAERIQGSGSVAKVGQVKSDRRAAEEGRLLARPARPGDAAPAGLHPLGLGGRRDGMLYVPVGYRPD